MPMHGVPIRIAMGEAPKGHVRFDMQHTRYAHGYSLSELHLVLVLHHGERLQVELVDVDAAAGAICHGDPFAECGQSVIDLIVHGHDNVSQRLLLLLQGFHLRSVKCPVAAHVLYTQPRHFARVVPVRGSAVQRHLAYAETLGSTEVVGDRQRPVVFPYPVLRFRVQEEPVAHDAEPKRDRLVCINELRSADVRMLTATIVEPQYRPVDIGQSRGANVELDDSSVLED